MLPGVHAARCCCMRAGMHASQAACWPVYTALAYLCKADLTCIINLAAVVWGCMRLHGRLAEACGAHRCRALPAMQARPRS